MTPGELKKRVREIIVDFGMPAGMQGLAKRYGSVELGFEVMNEDGIATKAEQAIYDLMLDVVGEDEPERALWSTSDVLQMSSTQLSIYENKAVNKTKNDLRQLIKGAKELGNE